MIEGGSDYKCIVFHIENAYNTKEDGRTNPANRRLNLITIIFIVIETTNMNPFIKFFILFSFSYLTSFAQKNSENNDTTIYTVVDKFPILITNERKYELDKIYEFIEKYKTFPSDPQDCSGKVIVSVVVEKDGTIKYKDYVLKLCSDFDKSSMNVVNLMKNWNPGIKDGKRVRTKINLTIKWKW